MNKLWRIDGKCFTIINITDDRIAHFLIFEINTYIRIKKECEWSKILVVFQLLTGKIELQQL